MTRPVLLLHGIWNVSAWVSPLVLRLRAEGFEAEAFGYPSVFGGPEVAVPRLIAYLREAGEIDLVGHSLGGMVALEALRQVPELPVRRVVCLGSPLRGSGAARGAARNAWTAAALGRSAELLQQGFERWDGPAQVGMVAGSIPHGLGHYFTELSDASDGTVALEETRLPGLTDHCAVAASHSGLLLSTEAASQVASFLRKGRFRHGGG